MKFSTALLFLVTFGRLSAQAPDGALLFNQNCAACHQLDQMIVGPSLVEMRTLYQDKPADFVKWAIAPQKKRPNAIEMPSMAHLGEPALLAIHGYIMKAAEGAKEKKAAAGDRFAGSPTQAVRPLVMRIFMPDAGPASIAVALDSRVSFCWDAGPCRLRYVWTGGFVDGYAYWRGNGHGLAKPLAPIRYAEASPLLGDVAARFRGYDVDAKGFPTFRYQLGALEVSESYLPLEKETGFTRKFTFAVPVTDALALTFPDVPEKTGVRSDAGAWSGKVLTLPAGTTSFTLTHVFP